jgi:hypothetical protein
MLTRILPKPNVARDDATRMAWNNGWQYQDMFLADEERPFEKIWLADDHTSVHWIEDAILELNYFAVQGEQADEVAETIREDVDTYDRSELREMVESAERWNEFLVALHHAAAAAPAEFDPEFFEWFGRGFNHEHPIVRKMTVILTSYPGWPQFRTPLEQVLGDEDPEVRDLAEGTLRKLDAAPDEGNERDTLPER